MGIKPNARRHFEGKSEETRLALAISECFDISFGKIHGDKSFWIADPNQRTRDRFGLSQEVLVIYSHHTTTDARFMTAIENIMRNPDFKHRLDKVFVILIHNGDEKDAEKLINKQHEWVIMPLVFTELLDESNGDFFIRSKIAKHFGSIDLFGMSSPIETDKYFFGRDETVSTLIKRSLDIKQSSGLFGLRKTGKTSVLYAIKRRTLDRMTIAEYFDCQNPGIHSSRWWQFLRHIAIRLNSTLNQDHGKQIDVQKDYNQSSAGVKFIQDIKKILDCNSVNSIILMLDEVEWVTPHVTGFQSKHWDEDFFPFWQTIRAAHQELDKKLTFIVAGVNPSCISKPDFNGIVNPLLQLALPHYLDSLPTPMIKVMVETIGKYAGLSFSNDSFDYLRNTYGGHPYLIRLACSSVWGSSDISDPVNCCSIVVSKFLEVRDDITARLSDPIKDILLSLVWWYPDEYDVLQILASGEVEFVDDYLSQNRSMSEQFVKWGLLNGQNSGEFAIYDVKLFLNTNGDVYKKAVSPFIRGDIPPEVLPVVPDLEVLSRLFEKKTELEIKLRKILIMYLGVKNAWNNTKIANDISSALRKRPGRPRPSDLFVGREPKDVVNELFTLDLKDIILHHWSVFSGLFSSKKDIFELNMENINKARRVDSHTKPVSKDEYDSFINSYDWILLAIKDVPGL